MQRFFSIIIACCLVFLAITSLMDSKNNSKENTVVAGKMEATQIAIAPKTPSPVSERSNSSWTSKPELNALYTALAQTTAREESKTVDEDLEILAASIDEPQQDSLPQQAVYSEPVASDTKQIARYSKDEAWEYTAQAENDLAALDNLLN